VHFLIVLHTKKEVASNDHFAKVRMWNLENDRNSTHSNKQKEKRTAQKRKVLLHYALKP